MSNANLASLSEPLYAPQTEISTPLLDAAGGTLLFGKPFSWRTRKFDTHSDFTMVILVAFSVLAIAIGHLIVSALEKREDVLSGRYIRR